MTGSNQVAGYVEVRDGLTFATVHGTGHKAAQWKRAETLYVVNQWINEKSI
jgi:hypothetical protein